MEQNAATATVRQVALIVEDEPTLGSLVSDALSIFGWETKVATTASEVLALVDSEKFDAVLADVSLADGSTGFEAISHVFSAGASARAVLMSGGSIDEIRERCREVLGTELPVLQKPFSIVELRAVLE